MEVRHLICSQLLKFGISIVINFDFDIGMHIMMLSVANNVKWDIFSYLSYMKKWGIGTFLLIFALLNKQHCMFILFVFFPILYDLIKECTFKVCMEIEELKQFKRNYHRILH